MAQPNTKLPTDRTVERDFQTGTVQPGPGMAPAQPPAEDMKGPGAAEEFRGPDSTGGKANPDAAPPLAGMRPGGPNNPDPGYTPGPDYVGPTTGAESAGDLTGAGAGGDIDLPDITGRGTTRAPAKGCGG